MKRKKKLSQYWSNVELVKWRINYVIGNLQNNCQKMLNMLNV